MEGDNTGTSGISLFGSLTKQGGHFDEGPQFPPRGDMYRDTSHLNSAKTGPMYGESGFYRDTRHMTPSKPRPNAGTEGGFLDAPGTDRLDLFDRVPVESLDGVGTPPGLQPQPVVGGDRPEAEHEHGPRVAAQALLGR